MNRPVTDRCDENNEDGWTFRRWCGGTSDARLSSIIHLGPRRHGVNIVILLRLAGESRALPELGSCLNSKLVKMPDVKIATAPVDRVRFIVDVIAGKGADDGISASLVIAETFPMEQFRPRLKEGEEADGLLSAMRYHTLLRLHEVVPGRTAQSVCTKVAAEISDKLLSKEIH
jgi:hypothetical protein